MSFVFREDGYFNMTKAAAHFGRHLENFSRLPSTVEYLNALSETYSVEITELVKSKAGRYGGTFAHPKLAVFFARWLDIRFAVWCDSIIEDILTKKADLTITQPATSATVQVSQQMPEFMLAIQQIAQGIIYT